MRSAWLPFIALLAAGCATTLPSPRREAPVETAPPVPIAPRLPLPPAPAEAPPLPSTAAPPVSPRAAAPSPAVVALLDQATLEAQRGHGEQAAATLERAIRIEPRNPWPWHRLAVLRLQQQRFRDAIDLANKSIALARGDRGLLSGNYELIAQALAAAGDRDGAARARARSRAYGDPGAVPVR